MESQIIKRLDKAKLCFYQLLTNHADSSYRDLVQDTCRTLQSLFSFSGVAVYEYDNWRKAVELVAVCGTPQNSLRCIYPHAGPDAELTPVQLRIKRDDHAFLLPLHKNEEEKLGYLLVETAEYELPDEAEELALETGMLVQKLQQFFRAQEAEKKNMQLYQVATKLHASIDMRDVLRVVIEMLREAYPEFIYTILLSQDYPNETELPIKNLIYDVEEHSASTKAYITGEVQMEMGTQYKKSHLFVPLKGKQGIYGVLQVSMPANLLFPVSDVEFISRLADSAGNALENARLYQQSRKLISELQLINETSQSLNANLRLSDTITLMHHQIKATFGGEEIGFILYREGADAEQILKGSTSFFTSEQAGPFLKLMAKQFNSPNKEALFISNFAERYPEVVIPFRSLLAIPMAQSDQLRGVVIVLHRNPSFFTFESFRLIESLVQHSSLSIVNSMLREKLEKLVITDYLTSLYSRNYLDERMQLHIKEDRQGGFILLDVDDFKQVNDTYGHNTGDYILIQVANIIKDVIEASDFAARWGGEELAVYLPHRSMTETIEIAERIVRQVSEGTRPGVTMSCGIAVWSEENPMDVEQLFTNADRALYEAKRNGKNQYRI